MADPNEFTENLDDDEIEEYDEFEELNDEPIEEAEDKFFTKKDKKQDEEEDEEEDDDGIEYNQIVDDKPIKKQTSNYPNMTIFEYTTMCSTLATLIENDKVTVPQEIIDTDPYGSSAKLAINWGANYKKYPVPVDIIRNYNGSYVKINPSKLNNTIFDGVFPGIDEIDNHYFLNDFKL